MSNAGFRIYTKINRPSKELIEYFRDMAVPNIADNMGRLSCMDSEIKPFNGVKLLGPALTVRSPMADNLMFHKAIDMAQPGDIIVVDAQGDMNHSVCGEIMFRYAMSRGVGGFIVDGCVRDSSTLKDMNFPVYAKGVNPKGPYKNGPGEINVSISCGGQVVNPGDIVVGDEDGIVVIKPEDAQSIYEKTLILVENEKKTFININAGTLDRSWVDKTLEEKGCEIIE